MNIIKAVLAYSKSHGTSVANFERLAGVSKGTIYNISSGRSRHPRTDTMGKIASALERIKKGQHRIESKNLNQNFENYVMDYTQAQLENFQDESESAVEARFSKTHYNTTPPIHRNTSWNINLYLDATKCIIDEMQVKLPKDETLEIIDELYNYSIKAGLDNADRNFARWILEK